MKLVFPDNTIYTSQEMQDPFVFHFTFSDSSKADSYYSALNDYYLSLSPNASYSIKGDIAYLYLNSTLPSFHDDTVTGINWKTGILTLDYGKEYYTNGTIYFESAREMISRCAIARRFAWRGGQTHGPGDGDAGCVA